MPELRRRAYDHHFTIGCAPDDLPVLRESYTRTLGLHQGYRPALRHLGHWLYANGQAIVHLNALHLLSPPAASGPFDHVGLKAHGLDSTRAFLRTANMPFSGSPLNGTTLHQVFLRDPLGVRIELNFELDIAA